LLKTFARWKFQRLNGSRLGIFRGGGGVGGPTDIRLFLAKSQYHSFGKEKNSKQQPNGINFAIAVADAFVLHFGIIYLNKHLVF